MKWYAIIFNHLGVQIAKSPVFSNSEQAIFWAKSVMRGHTNATYQLFQC